MKRNKNTIEIKAGTLLLAEPFLADPHFKRSVVLICEHNQEGSLGFILNKPVGMKLDRLVSDFPNFNHEVFYGGPVQTDTIHYVHSKGDLIEDSLEIDNGLYWGGNFQQIKFCIENELMSPFDIKFFVGYSGWGEGQLDEELGFKSWLSSIVEKNYVFSGREDAKKLWKKVLEDEGDIYSVIAQIPLPIWN